MPDTYRELAHALNESLEDALMSIESYDEMMRIREWADRELRPRLRALDEAGPYGYVVEVDHMGNGVFDRLDGTIEDSRDAAVEMVPEPGCRGKNQWRIIPLYAGAPEEVDGD